MKRFTGLIVLLVGGVSAFAQQQAAPSVKMECRNLSTSGIAPVVNTQIAPGAAFISL
jgi:hypothetical protein